MSTAEVIAATIALLVSIASFVIGLRSDLRTQKAEAIRNLLGDKETVAYAAIRPLRQGLPETTEERQLVIAALLQACILEGSNRARALLYRVIEKNLDESRAEITDSLAKIHETFTIMGKYKFEQEQLNLKQGLLRISAMRKIIDYKEPHLLG